MRYSGPRKIFGISRRLVAGSFIAVFYLAVVLADFLAPYDHREQARVEPSAPASTVRFTAPDGTFSFRPFIYASRLADPLARVYAVEETSAAPLQFFVHGYPYHFFGLIPSDIHLFGTGTDQKETIRIHLLGTDALGRDRFSRLLLANRFSLLVSPGGTALACIIGILVGLVSGYGRRLVDSALMGVADAMLSLPTLIIILAARAAFPLELPPVTAAVLLIGIFSLTGWAGIARLTRSLVRAAREQGYVTAAVATGIRPSLILLRHILPNISRPLIVQATLMLPVFLLSEAALSFLGVGLQEPEPSLGNMLTAAADLDQLLVQPFLLLAPAALITSFVFTIRLLAADRGRAVKH